MRDASVVKKLNYVHRSSKCLFNCGPDLNVLCDEGTWYVERCFQLEHDDSLRWQAAIKAKKSDSMIMRIMLRAARAIHRRHKSSLQSVCKPSKEISFKFFFSKVFQQLFYLPVGFFLLNENDHCCRFCWHSFSTLILFLQRSILRKYFEHNHGLEFQQFGWENPWKFYSVYAFSADYKQYSITCVTIVTNVTNITKTLVFGCFDAIIESKLWYRSVNICASDKMWYLCMLYHFCSKKNLNVT